MTDAKELKQLRIFKNNISSRRVDQLMARMGYLELQKMEIKSKISSAKKDKVPDALAKGFENSPSFFQASGSTKSQVILINYLVIVEDLLAETTREIRRLTEQIHMSSPADAEE